MASTGRIICRIGYFLSSNLAQCSCWSRRANDVILDGIDITQPSSITVSTESPLDLHPHPTHGINALSVDNFRIIITLVHGLEDDAIDIVGSASSVCSSENYRVQIVDQSEMAVGFDQDFGPEQECFAGISFACHCY